MSSLMTMYEEEYDGRSYRSIYKDTKLIPTCRRSVTFKNSSRFRFIFLIRFNSGSCIFFTFNLISNELVISGLILYQILTNDLISSLRGIMSKNCEEFL